MYIHKSASLIALLLLIPTTFIFPVAVHLFPIEIVAAQTTQSREALADQMLQQGLEQYRNSKIKEAIQSLQKAVTIYREIGSQIKVVNSLDKIGIGYFAQGNFQNAKEFHEEALKIAREIAYKEGEARSLNSLGNSLNFLKENKEAILLHEKALEIAKKINSGQEKVRALNGLGNAYRSPKNHEKSIKFYEESLEIAKSIGYEEGESKSLTNLGGVYTILRTVFGLGVVKEAIHRVKCEYQLNRSHRWIALPIF